MDLYTDLDTDNFFDTDYKQKLLRFVGNSPILRKFFDTSKDSMRTAHETAGENEWVGLTCTMNLRDRESWRSSANLVELNFSGMPGLCSTIVMHDFHVYDYHKGLTAHVVARADELISQSDYSCALYSLLHKQIVLRKALEVAGFELVHDLQHVNKRTGSVILFLSKFYNQ